jgi:nucleobase transporter 1/2
LPIIQGGTFSFLAPTFAILALPENVCPPDFDTRFTEDEKTEEWQRRMREIQGAIIVASFFQVFIGYFGIIGLMLKYITPMTIAPAVSIIGLSLFDVAGDYAAGNWGIAAG